jgi:chaperonin GroEL
MAIEAIDETEQLGVGMVKEALSIASAAGGDGTTTTAVLLQAIVDKLFDSLKDDGSLLKKKINAVELKKNLDKWCETVVENLRASARPITPADIFNVAFVAGEYEWIAKMVTEVYEKVGKDGYVSVEEGLKSEYEIFKGIELDTGYTSEYFITNDNRECIIENPLILVTNQRIDESAIGALLGLISSIASQGKKELVLVAPEFSRDILSRLITTKLKADFSVLALKLPTFDKDDLLIDITTLTAGKFLDKNTYQKFEAFADDFKLENLGKAERAIIGDGKTVIIGGAGDTARRVEDLKSIREKTESAFDKDKLDRRVAYLSGGVAAIKIGGVSEFEKTYSKLKCENAVAAVAVALKEGVVKGGGLALKEVADGLPPNYFNEILYSPHRQIQENSGGIEISEAVIDPVAITISALRSACSLAGLIITTETTVAYKREKHGPQNQNEN